MAAEKTLKVKDIVKKYGFPQKFVLEQLKSLGLELKSATSSIPEDSVEIVELQFAELVEKKRAPEHAKGKKTSSSGEKTSETKTVVVHPPLIVKTLAEALGKRPNEVVSGLMKMNVLASINQAVDFHVAQQFARTCGIELTAEQPKKQQKPGEGEDPESIEIEDDPKDLLPRCPIVTFMGHVDHGKTSLQDCIRKTHVAKGEAGGITQNIGASVATIKGKNITFVDTPGHEAFTAMRARGANVTDIVVLVVAADDGFMPQTVEALNHAKAAKVPIIVAINKIDLPDANPDKVYLHMQQNGLCPEEWGGETGVVKVSAKTGQGVPDLLERILLEAEMLELKANPKRPGMAYVLESQLELGFGPTASVIVLNGSVRQGDFVICGEYWGKIKNIVDAKGTRVKAAGPGTPVQIAGLSGVPEAGTKLVVCQDEHTARAFAEKRAEEKRQESLAQKSSTGATLEDLFSQMESNTKQTLCVVLKGDVNGSVEAIQESFRKLPSEKIAVNVVHSGVGPITENDVLLAASSHGIVVGFHVRVNAGVNALAKKENVEIRLYSIIYELIEDITDALSGRLEPEKRERELGVAKILKIFELSKGPKICGCVVEKGVVKVGAKARVYRAGELIFNGEVRSLRRFQDDVREVKTGLECGIKLDNFLDFVEGDQIQIYDIELKKASLS